MSGRQKKLGKGLGLRLRGEMLSDRKENMSESCSRVFNEQMMIFNKRAQCANGKICSLGHLVLE